MLATSEPPDQEAITARRAASATPAFGPDILQGPKLRLPDRNYLLFQGPLAYVMSFGRREQLLGGEVLKRHAPDLIWPNDQAWFIATDVDLDCAYVGGSQPLIEEAISDERLAASPVTAHDPLLEAPTRLQHGVSNELSDRPPAHSLVITNIERDHRGIQIRFQIVPPISSPPVALHAEVRDDQDRQYDTLGWEHGFAREPATTDGVLRLPLPEPDATALSIRLWWGGWVAKGSRRPEHRLRITL